MNSRGENILRQLRGDDVGRATLAPLPCTSDSPETIEAVIEVDSLGRVRFTFSRFHERRERAERAG